MRSTTLLSLIAALLTAICAAGYATQDSRGNDRKPDPHIASSQGYKISFERTGCFGICPVFVLLIDEDGTTQLQMPALHEDLSESYVRRTLLFESKLLPEKHAALIRHIEEGGFRRLKLDYSAMVTDNPSTMIAIDTPQGHWSTHVYAVPCESEGARWSESHRRDWGITEFVPDIFCELSERLGAVACETYLHGTRLGPHHDLKPFRPPHCRKKI